MNVPYGSYLMLLSIHGLLRGRRPELGRDADTGGQILYVLELAKALIRHPDVAKVDLVTRLIEDKAVDDDYAHEIEPLAGDVSIVRIRCGPKRYVRKELLWPYMDNFVDNLVQYLRSIERVPDLIHGHYADAGYVASQLGALLDVPMVFTGHSLGRVKRQRLLDSGSKPESIEKRYNMNRRIEAEEIALSHAAFVVASTNQEVAKQYESYEFYQPKRMLVVPPGVNLERFSPPRGLRLRQSALFEQLRPFLEETKKPMVLTISRADPRKNIGTLIRGYAGNEALREKANLIIVAGNREDIHELDGPAREVMTELLYLIDRYDLYGSVAYPKHHRTDDVPEYYRLAAKSGGVFVNPALTEPFGLTLLEAAASGLPVVSTDDGGPRDIIRQCKNGVLVDPLDADAMGTAILDAINDRDRWRRWSRSGIRGSQRHFSWSANVDKYMRAVKTAVVSRARRREKFGLRSRLITADRVLICDIDNTLTGDRDGLAELRRILDQRGESTAFGIATGRSLELTQVALRKWKIPTPQLLITSVGSAIRYGRNLVEDKGWDRHINYRWRRDALLDAMAQVPGVELQKAEGQSKFKISFDVDPENLPPIPKIRRHLRGEGLQARLIYSHGAYLDLLPIRASKGAAVRHCCINWGIAPERCLVAGDSGNDREMLTGNHLAVVVANYEDGLEQLRDHPQVYFAPRPHAWGIIDGIEHYDFLGDLTPDPSEAVVHAPVSV